MEKAGNILRIHAITVLVSSILMMTKFLAWYLTGSNAILTDALESIVNVLAGSFAWYSLWLSFKPRDHDHPYGHGKIEFISATLEGSLILIAGLSIFFKSVYNFFFPQEIQEIGTGIWLVAAAGLVNFVMGLYLRKKGEKVASMTLKANGQHLLTDAWSSLGLLIGLFLVWMSGEVWVDNLLGLLFGAYIAWAAGKIIRRSIAGIMDEADFALLEELVAFLNKKRRKEWIDIHNLRVIQYGRMLHIDCHITLPWYYSLQDAHDTIKEVDQTIYEKYQEVELFIHMDPCIPHSCRICSIESCSVRQKPFEALQEWDVATLLKNQKHGA